MRKFIPSVDEGNPACPTKWNEGGSPALKPHRKMGLFLLESLGEKFIPSEVGGTRSLAKKPHPFKMRLFSY